MHCHCQMYFRNHQKHDWIQLIKTDFNEEYFIVYSTKLCKRIMAWINNGACTMIVDEQI